MKKGLFSILAGALLVVGCQNYDDQFSNIESQITALASQVAGLSQVQSDLTALAGTVNSLQTSVASTVDSAVNTALADGLADIATATAALETAAATAASAADVQAISDAVTANQTDLTQLLANSSVFTGAVTINSVATLSAFYDLRGTLKIVNGSVDITVSTDMDLVKVQEVVNSINTVTGDFKYTSLASSIAEVTFNTISGVQSLTLKQAGGYQLQELVSATVVNLDAAYENKVLKIDFRKLISVTSFQTGTVTNTIDFSSATELHLTVLPRYAPGTLTINISEGGALPIAALDDVDANGVQTDMTLDITGPLALTLTKITDGAITLKDVATATIAGFTGTLTVGAGVKTLTVTDGVKVVTTGASDLVTASIGLKYDDDTSLTATAIAALPYGTNGNLDFSTLTDLETLTITGKVNDITLSGNTSLKNLTIAATCDDLTITGSTDLVGATFTGSFFNDVSITANTKLATLVLDHTTRLTKTGVAATAVEKGASLTVTGNTKLTSLTSSADHIDALTVQNNAKLVTIDFTGLKDGGTSTTATVLIGGAVATKNNLEATIITDSYDVAPATLNTGAFTAVDSKIKTLQTYLDVAVTKPSASGVKVFLDGADSHIAKGATAAADVETTSLVIGASAAVTAKLAVVDVDVSNAVTSAGAQAAIRSVFMKHAGTAVVFSAVEGLVGANPTINTANQALWATEFITDNGANFTAVGVTVTYAEAGAAVNARGTGSATFDVLIAAAAATQMAYGESIKLGVGSTVVSIPLSMTGTATTGSVTIAGVAVGFDVTAGTSVGASLYPHTAVHTTASGTAYVSSSTELHAAIIAYMNQADRTTADYKNGTTVANSQDKKRWTVTADATAETLNFQIDGYMTKALTGQIVAEHMDGANTTQQATLRYQDETTTAVTTAYSAGVILRFARTTAGVDSNYTLAKSSGSTTLFNTHNDYDGADNKVYAPAAASGNSSALYRGLTLDNSAHTGTHTNAVAAAGAALNTALETNYDNLTDADFAWGINAGDTSANTAQNVDRTSWL